MRCLGVVIYPDGSQAEVWDTEQSHISFRPIKPRRLTFAPFYLLVSMLWLLSGCIHLQVRGTKPVCLIDYHTGIKHCKYDTWKACKADLRDGSMCSPR